MSSDVLWSTAVRCYELVRDVYWGCLASAVELHGLFDYDSSMEAEHGCPLVDCGNDFTGSGGSASIRATDLQLSSLSSCLASLKALIE